MKGEHGGCMQEEETRRESVNSKEGDGGEGILRQKS